jgi:hypothetical protein
LLEEKLYRKLKKILLVHAKRNFINGKLHFKYTNAEYYELKSFEHFLIAIEKGYIRVTFKIGCFKSGQRYGQLHDHGTSFDLNLNYIFELYDLVDAT